MAESDPDKTQFARSAGKRARFRGLTQFIGFIILLEAIALGLKAYDDRQQARVASEAVTQGEAGIVSEFVSGKIAGIIQHLRFGTEAGWSPEHLAGSHPDIDRVELLPAVGGAGSKTRPSTRAGLAAAIAAQQERAALHSSGDLIVIDPGGQTGRFAVVKSQQLLPGPERHRHSFALQNQGHHLVDKAGQLTKCSAIFGTALESCATVQRPVFAQRDLLNLVVYLLLLVGPALGLAGLLQLATDNRHRAEMNETSVRRTGKMLTTVLRETKAGFWSIDVDQKHVWLSAEAATLMQAPGEGHYRFSALDHLVQSPDHGKLTDAITDFAKTGQLDLNLSNRDQTRWLHMHGHSDTDSHELCGVLLDVTDVEDARRRSQRAEQHLRSALEGFSGPFALWGANRRLVYWNQAFARVFNLEDTLRVGISRQTVSLAQAASTMERHSRPSGTAGDIVRVASGSWFKMIERETPSGEMITMGFDVTVDIRNEVEQAAQQKKLRQLVVELERSEMIAGELAEKLQVEKTRAEESANSKSAFLANMSHELRTPLNAINGFSEILASEMYGPLGDRKYQEYARDILASGQHLLDMINDILDMAKIEAGKMTVDLRPIDLTDPADAAVRMMRRKAEDKGVKLRLIANDHLPLVDADHRAIKQMVLNLVSNAIKFTDTGGDIRVTLDRKGTEIRVAVRDTGIGIPAEALPRLAEPFEQISDTRGRNYDGTGLGLALTRAFAEMQGGRLTIASEEHKGTQVSFFLPIRASQIRHATNAA